MEVLQIVSICTESVVECVICINDCTTVPCNQEKKSKIGTMAMKKKGILLFLLPNSPVSSFVILFCFTLPMDQINLSIFVATFSRTKFVSQLIWNPNLFQFLLIRPFCCFGLKRCLNAFSCWNHCFLIWKRLFCLIFDKQNKKVSKLWDKWKRWNEVIWMRTIEILQCKEHFPAIN